MGDQTTAIADIRTDLRELRSEMNGSFRSVSTEFSSLRSEIRQEFGSFRADMDRRFTAVDARLAAADGKFTWLIGIQVGMLLMIASAALGFFFK